MKNLRYGWFIIIFFLTMLSCKEDGGSQYNLDIKVDLSVVDENGTDLLDPDNPEAYPEDNIRIFYLVDGEKQEIYESNLDYPRMFFIYKHEGWA